jgi:hypothetical protein
MDAKHPQSTASHWRCCALIALLLALTAWTCAWPMQSPGAELPVVVHEGQLSVDLWEAPVRDVLAAIGLQAGLDVYADAAANATVYAQFTGVALDEGLRRLLRAASLSYSFLYVRDPAKMVTLQEVRVFGVTPGSALTSHDERTQRAAAPWSPLPREEYVGPVQDAEPEPEAQLESVDLEQDGDVTQD